MLSDYIETNMKAMKEEKDKKKKRKVPNQPC